MDATVVEAPPRSVPWVWFDCTPRRLVVSLTTHGWLVTDLRTAGLMGRARRVGPAIATPLGVLLSTPDATMSNSWSMSVPSIALIVALTSGCSLMLETVHVQPLPDVAAVDVVGIDAGTDREAVDATGDDASRDVTRFDHILPADVPSVDAAIDVPLVDIRLDEPLPDASQLDATFVEIAPVDDVLLLDRTERPDFGLVSDVIASLDGGSAESGPPRDVVASFDATDAMDTARDAPAGSDVFDGSTSRDVSFARDTLLDVHVTSCGMAVPPYACTIPTTCAEIDIALAAAAAAAEAIPCCNDTDCDAIISDSLCCPNEAVAPSGPATQCADRLVAQGCPRPTVCPLRLCRVVLRGSCSAGMCVPVVM